MYKCNVGVRSFAKNSTNPFAKNSAKIDIEYSPKNIQINQQFLPTILGLSRTGIKILLYFLENNSSDTTVIFNLNECKKFCGFNDKRSIYNGLIELLGENIIARTENENIYFLNSEIIKTCG